MLKPLYLKKEIFNKSDFKIQLSKPKDYELFVDKMHKIFDSNYYWSVVISSKFNTRKIHQQLIKFSALAKNLKKIEIFATIIFKTDMFVNQPFYRHQKISSQIKNEF